MKSCVAAFFSMAIVSVLPNQCRAQISLSQDFDSGSLDVAASTVNGSDVQLVGRESWAGVDGYRWVYFEASNVQGLTPQFSISSSDFLGSYAGHRYVYSYDQQIWEFFENASDDGETYRFSNNSPFTQDIVYVAYGIPYPVSRTTDYVEQLQTNPLVTPTISGDANFVVGQSAAGFDDVGRFVPVQDLYGFKITNPSEGSPTKLKILVASGSHPGEPAGNYALEGLLDFLLSSDAAADQLRDRIEFYVYPQTNPAGRFGGYYRSNPENSDKDYNRFFNDPTGFTDLAALTAAMQADTGGDVDFLLDFHSWFGSWSSENFVFALPELVDDPFFVILESLEPGLLPTASTGHPGMLRIWGTSAKGLNADFGMTPEIGFHPFRYEPDLKAIGQSFGEAFYLYLPNPLDDEYVSSPSPILRSPAIVWSSE